MGSAGRRAFLFVGVLICLVAQGAWADLRFSVTYPAATLNAPFSGRVVVYLSKASPSPKDGPDWFNPEPMYSAAFKNVRPGQPMVVSDANCTGFPGKIAKLPAGEWKVQAVIDRYLGGRAIGASAGNLYSNTATVPLDPSKPQTVAISCRNIVAAPKFTQTAWLREAKVQSKLLSAYYGRPTRIMAAVVLPEAWAREPARKFPVIYEIPGFGGNHYVPADPAMQSATMRGGEPFIFVMLDPDCPTGHCVFADSANNGPWGTALTTELIPYIEKTYRAYPMPNARFVTGHSSGGWSSLWLQVAYPDFFGGVWSTSPDPVDFRDFQRIDLYKPGVNMFKDEHGKPRPLARRGDTPWLYYKPFSDMERPIRGEQLGSFDAVFSPRGADGQPMKLWNRNTGAVDPRVAAAWKKYDIDLVLRTHWKELAPRLVGKLHVFTGDMDTFYLEGAVKLLKRDLAALHSDAEVEIVSGDHGSMMTPALRSKIDREMAAAWRKAIAPGR